MADVKAKAYYNEIDPHAAQWLRNLIAAGHIADGDVDERSIVDVRASDVAGYRQCHFFAGIGGWSYAARLAGWPDDREMWTGSCPCQPFSQAGQGGGFSDERHLWPAFAGLIRERRPAVVFGEQVASKDAGPWLDLVQADVEAMGHAFGAVPFPAASVGAPHIRDRLYWVADSNDARLEGWREPGCERGAEQLAGPSGVAGGLADADRPGRSARERDDSPARYGDSPSAARFDGRLADPQSGGRGEERADAGRIAIGDQAQGIAAGLGSGSGDMRPGPTNGFWRDADWLFCRDGRWRPVEPGTFPLVDGTAFKLGSGGPLEGKSRAGMLRAYGNAIVVPQAAEFLRAFMECRP